jgi:hypothetical protein
MLVRRLGLLPMELQLLMPQELSLLLVWLRLPEKLTAKSAPAAAQPRRCSVRCVHEEYMKKYVKGNDKLKIAASTK